MLKKNMFHFLLSIVFFVGQSALPVGPVSNEDRVVNEELITKLKGRLHQYVLDNGMHVICIPMTNSNVVSVGSFVRVGSMHETSTEYGMAHILEHMVFKGTKTRKEGDLDRLCQHFGMQIGRDYNAFTGHACTFYYFKTDDKNWKIFADVVADSTQNLDVLPAPLNSELQAISQEIKLRKEDAPSFELADFLPMNHPCSHRIIGYKEEVLSYTADEVMAFYNKHYIPSKTTFFVCGNVEPAEVFAYAQQKFATFTRGNNQGAVLGETSQRLPFYAGFATTNKTLYHTQEAKILEFTWQGVAIGAADDAPLDYAVSALGRRLRQKYVDELGYCSSISVGSYSVGPAGIVEIIVKPQPQYYDFDFSAAVTKEISDIQTSGITEAEFAALYQERLLSLVSSAEAPFSILKSIAFRSASYADPVAGYFAEEEAFQRVTQDDIKRVAYMYLRPFLMHSAVIKPLPIDEQATWQALQAEVNAHEKELLSARARTDELSLAQYADTSNLPERLPLDLVPDVVYDTFTLSNGLVVYWRSETLSPRCACVLAFKNVEEIEKPLQAAGKSFAWSVAPELLMHGTDQYSAKELDDLLSVKGASLDASSEGLSLYALKNNFEEGLRLLRLVLDKKNYDQEFFDRKKQEALDYAVMHKNDPRYRLDDYLNQTMYAAYPWKFSEEERLQNLKKVAIEDAIECLSLLRDPSRTALVLTGDLNETEARIIAERYFGDLRETSSTASRSVVAPEVYVVNHHISLPIEQSLVYALRSGCTRGDADLPSLSLLAAYFSKKVWDIREQTGLFYSGGARLTEATLNVPGCLHLIAQTTPGNMIAVKQQLCLLLESVFSPGVITPELLDVLKNEFKHKAGTYFINATVVANRAVDALVSNHSFNYEREFEEQVMALTFDDFQAAVRKYCDPSTWSFVTIGQKVA